jgi:hypothetical protein
MESLLEPFAPAGVHWQRLEGLPAMTQSPWVRPTAFAALILFLSSWVFPIGAGIAKDTSVLPKWWGAVDVALAFALATAAFGIPALVRGRSDKRAEETSYRAYRIATHGLLAVAVTVMMAGDRITWANCATGFMWRTWLGLYILPWWITAVRANGSARA